MASSFDHVRGFTVQTHKFESKKKTAFEPGVQATYGRERLAI